MLTQSFKLHWLVRTPVAGRAAAREGRDLWIYDCQATTAKHLQTASSKRGTVVINLILLGPVKVRISTVSFHSCVAADFEGYTMWITEPLNTEPSFSTDVLFLNLQKVQA